MPDFDNNLRSKLDSFNPGINPTPAEIDRLNASLDLLAKSRYGIKHLLWLLLILLFLGSQFWLIYSNRILRKELFSTKESISELNMEHDADRRSFEKALTSVLEQQKRQETTAAQPVFDSAQFISRYLIRNQKSERKYLEDALLRRLNESGISGQGSIISNKGTQLASDTKLTLKEEESGTDKEKTAGTLKLNQGNKGSKDTIVVRETVLLDSILFDSLYKEVSALKSNFEKDKVSPPLLKTPLPFAWSASLGLKPGYSNLYLVDGRVVLDAHFVTGVELNNTWAVNAGIKYKMITIHEDLDFETSPLSQATEFPADVVATGTELEGRAYGFYVPMDIRYTADIGGISPYVRVGSDMNIVTVDDLKIEYGNDEYFYFERDSRKLSLTNVSIGLGGSSVISDKWQIEYEAGYLVGNGNLPLVLREKNGAYLQFRLGYRILSRE